MWKKMQAQGDWRLIPKKLEEWRPEFKNPYPNLPLFLPGDMKFTYDADEQVDANRFVLEFGKGDITDFNDRFPFTQDVVARFYALYYRDDVAGSKNHLLGSLQRMESDADGF